jgi:uncharacterized protein (TIGR02611 family)
MHLKAKCMVPECSGVVHTGGMAEPDEGDASTIAGTPSDASPETGAGGSARGAATDRGETAAERRARIVAAAYHAEYQTGRKERTEDEAKRNIIIRLAIIFVGGVVFLAGLMMIVFPGPGIIVSLVGLGILAREFTWADRLMRTLRAKSHVDDMGRLPIWAQVGLGLVSIAAAFVGVAYLLFLR